MGSLDLFHFTLMGRASGGGASRRLEELAIDSLLAGKAVLLMPGHGYASKIRVTRTSLREQIFATEQGEELLRTRW